MLTHIIGQNASWTPLNWLSLQAGFNYVISETKTPAAGYTQSILNSQNNYWTVNFNSGFVLDDKTDLNLGYYYYRADDWPEPPGAMACPRRRRGGTQRHRHAHPAHHQKSALEPEIRLHPLRRHRVLRPVQLRRPPHLFQPPIPLLTGPQAARDAGIPLTIFRQELSRFFRERRTPIRRVVKESFRAGSEFGAPLLAAFFCPCPTVLLSVKVLFA